MQVYSADFKSRARQALQDDSLREALGNVVTTGFAAKRAEALELVPESEQIRREAKSIKDHTLDHLDHYLQLYEQQVIKNGGQVHWAESPEDAQHAIVTICESVNARLVAKGKSMVSEETAINEALEKAGMDVVETDLGEYIIQLAEEPPSHIIAPAIHKTKEQVSELFHEHHQQYGLHEKIDNRSDLVAEARQVLREKFLSADVGITGANFLIAETGQHILVTNEGNGDLSSNLPKVHIVIVGIEKVLPTLNDASCMLRLLARNGTGQHFSNYTSFMSGPRREGDLDGPDEFHVVLVDHGRTGMLENGYHEMLRCIRCGACMNHCPVYGSIGGHSYGWVYPGPMGSVLTPAMVGHEDTADLPHACTLNGRCAEVCPMSIPLPSLLRRHRQQTFEKGLVSGAARHGLGLWAFFARRPRLYRAASGMGIAVLHRLARRRGRLSRLPLASAWTASRELPAPAKNTFMSAYKKQSPSQGNGASH